MLRTNKSTREKSNNQSEIQMRTTWLGMRETRKRTPSGLTSPWWKYLWHTRRPGLLQLWIPTIQWQAETIKGYSKSASWTGSQKRRPLLASAAPGRWGRRHGSRRWNTPLVQEPPSSPPGNGSSRLASRKHAQPRQHGWAREWAFRGMNEVTRKRALQLKPHPLYYGVVDHEYLTTVHYTPSFNHFSRTHLPGLYTRFFWNYRGASRYLLWPKSEVFKLFDAPDPQIWWPAFNLRDPLQGSYIFSRIKTLLYSEKKKYI